jgi:hypothetical protein
VGLYKKHEFLVFKGIVCALKKVIFEKKKTATPRTEQEKIVRGAKL